MLRQELQKDGSGLGFGFSGFPDEPKLHVAGQRKHQRMHSQGEKNSKELFEFIDLHELRMPSLEVVQEGACQVLPDPGPVEFTR